MAVRLGSEQGQHSAEQAACESKVKHTVWLAMHSRGAGMLMGLEGDDPFDSQVEHRLELWLVVHPLVGEQHLVEIVEHEQQQK